jgi:hypothetical protein
VRKGAGAHVYAILFVILGLVLLAGYVVRTPSDHRVPAYQVTTARSLTADQPSVEVTDHAYFGRGPEPVWYNSRRSETSFRDAVIMVEDFLTRHYGGRVTVAIADDSLPLLIMEMPDYTTSRAKQVLCRVTKLLVKSGTLDGKEGIELQCEEQGSDGEGRFVNVCTRLEQARGLMCGSVSQTAFLRGTTIAQN